MSDLRLAATVMVFRHDSHRILMVQRSRKMSFFPNAWVFPGGRVDPADAKVQTKGEVEDLDNPAFAVSAIRECFEEAGVWLGEGTPSPQLRNKLNHREGNLLQEPSLVADLERLELWSRWVTPVAEPKRYDTRFFITQLREDEGFEAQADQFETVASRWFSPQEAVAAHQGGEIFLAPPTYLTLLQMTQFQNYDAVCAAAKTQERCEILPIHRKENGFEILLPGHPDHPKTSPNLGCTSLLLDSGRWLLRGGVLGT